MVKDDELMRGNFVMFFNMCEIGQIAIVDQVLRHSCLLKYTTKMNSDSGKVIIENQEIIVNYENIHGIPITSNILEKNGFTKRDCPADPNLLRYSFGMFEINQDKNNKDEWVIEPEYDGYPIRNVKYVHELQVFLKANETGYEIKEI